MIRLVAPIATAIALGASAGPSHDVTAQDKAFSRTEITIQRLDSVYFHNEDDVVHNVFSTSLGNRFNLKPQKPGTSVVVVFSTPGRAVVRCAFHPKMNLVVNVE